MQTLEIRAGEGGDDSCAFVQELTRAYARLLDAAG
jgi:protein subunit release factor A